LLGFLHDLFCYWKDVAASLRILLAKWVVARAATVCGDLMIKDFWLFFLGLLGWHANKK
jgi:hypothetical protein